MLYLNANDLKMYFLIGTEGPDAAQQGRIIDIPPAADREFLINDPILNPSHHQLRFTPAGTLREGYRYLADGAQEAAYIAKDCLDHGSCKGAAYMMGYMSHFIADAVFYPHLYESPNLSRLALLRARVYKMTTRKLSDWTYSEISSQEYDPPFFDHDPAWSEFYVKKPKFESAYLATWCAAYDAFFGFPIELHDPMLNHLVGFQSETHQDAGWLEQYNYAQRV